MQPREFQFIKIRSSLALIGRCSRGVRRAPPRSTVETTANTDEFLSFNSNKLCRETICDHATPSPCPSRTVPSYHSEAAFESTTESTAEDLRRRTRHGVQSAASVMLDRLAFVRASSIAKHDRELTSCTESCDHRFENLRNVGESFLILRNTTSQRPSSQCGRSKGEREEKE